MINRKQIHMPYLLHILNGCPATIVSAMTDKFLLINKDIHSFPDVRHNICIITLFLYQIQYINRNSFEQKSNTSLHVNSVKIYIDEVREYSTIRIDLLSEGIYANAI